MVGEKFFPITTPPCGAFTGTGRKTSIMAESGEALEVWWRFQWFGAGRFLPRWYYELRYYPGGPEEGEYYLLGECHFPEGCNLGHYYAPDANGNGIPDRFSRIEWNSWDYGEDDDLAGYLDHYQHTYDLDSDRYTVVRYWYFYPPGCRLPLSVPPFVCDIGEACDGPYHPAGREVVEERRPYVGSSGALSGR